MAVNDTFYISHGLATMAIDESLPARHFLKSWKDNFLTQRAKSILVVSGHWQTSVPTVNIVQRNESIHDFYGSPREIYQLKYPAPGAPELAKRVKELPLASGFDHVHEDMKMYIY